MISDKKQNKTNPIKNGQKTWILQIHNFLINTECSTTLASKEMHNKATMRYYYLPIQMAKMKKTGNVSKDVEWLELSYIDGMSKKGTATLRKVKIDNSWKEPVFIHKAMNMDYDYRQIRINYFTFIDD